MLTVYICIIVYYTGKYINWTRENKYAISVMGNEEKTDWWGIGYEILLGVSEGAYKLLCLLQHSNIIKKISGAQEREKSSFFDGHYSTSPTFISSTTPLTSSSTTPTFIFSLHSSSSSLEFKYLFFVSLFFFLPFWFQYATFLSSFLIC